MSQGCCSTSRVRRMLRAVDALPSARGRTWVWCDWDGEERVSVDPGTHTVTGQLEVALLRLRVFFVCLFLIGTVFCSCICIWGIFWCIQMYTHQTLHLA